MDIASEDLCTWVGSERPTFHLFFLFCLVIMGGNGVYENGMYGDCCVYVYR